MGNFSSVANLVAAGRLRRHYVKIGGTTVSSTEWIDGSNSGATTIEPVAISSPGSTAGATCDNTTAGALIPPQVSGQKIYLVGIHSIPSSATVEHAILVYDRLWHNSGLVSNSISTQTFSPVALPARGSTADGLIAFTQVWTSGGSATTGASISYTNEGGTSGHTGTAMCSTTSNSLFSGVGKMQMFSLQGGDKGVQSIQSMTVSVATATAGSVGLMIARPIVICSAQGLQSATSHAGLGATPDWMDLGLVEIDPAACLGIAYQGGGSTVSAVLEFVIG